MKVTQQGGQLEVRAESVEKGQRGGKSTLKGLKRFSSSDYGGRRGSIKKKNGGTAGDPQRGKTGGKFPLRRGCLGVKKGWGKTTVRSLGTLLRRAGKRIVVSLWGGGQK